MIGSPTVTFRINKDGLMEYFLNGRSRQAWLPTDGGLKVEWDDITITVTRKAKVVKMSELKGEVIHLRQRKKS
jgi:hypothetical protein